MPEGRPREVPIDLAIADSRVMILKYRDRVEDQILDVGEEHTFPPRRPRHARFDEGVDSGESDGVDGMDHAAHRTGLLRVRNERAPQNDQVVHLAPGQTQIGLEHHDEDRASGETGHHHGFRVNTVRAVQESLQRSPPFVRYIEVEITASVQRRPRPV